MAKPKTLSGKNVVKIFAEFGFGIVSQKGSHIKLQRIVENHGKQTLTIPLHEYLDKGTLKAIYRQSLRYIPEDALKANFYNT